MARIVRIQCFIGDDFSETLFPKDGENSLLLQPSSAYAVKRRNAATNPFEAQAPPGSADACTQKKRFIVVQAKICES
jgi:hypothetical protein